MMFSTKTKVIFTTLFSGMILSTGAYACSLDGWSSNTGAVDVGQPFGASAPDINGVSRYEELCALQVSGTGHVETDAPSHTRVRGRLYANPDFTGTGESNILVALDISNAELFKISWNNGSWSVDASANGGGIDSAASTGGWDLIEFDWNPASNELVLWINADAVNDAPTFTVTSGASTTLEAIQVGLPDGHGGGNSGNLFVDSVELHNETAIGPLLACDADANTIIEVEDAVAVIDEVFVVALAQGTPDCDANGIIEVEDAVATIDVIFAP